MSHAPNVRVGAAVTTITGDGQPVPLANDCSGTGGLTDLADIATDGTITALADLAVTCDVIVAYTDGQPGQPVGLDNEAVHDTTSWGTTHHKLAVTTGSTCRPTITIPSGRTADVITRLILVN